MFLGKILQDIIKNSHQLFSLYNKNGTTAADISKAPTVQPLKWLTDKTIWVKQWPLTIEKLQALEQLVKEQLEV